MLSNKLKKFSYIPKNCSIFDVYSKFWFFIQTYLGLSFSFSFKIYTFTLNQIKYKAFEYFLQFNIQNEKILSKKIVWVGGGGGFLGIFKWGSIKILKSSLQN